ncbi:MAG: type II secretion system F family protein [Vulcanimicrobiota bacterium]
MKRPIFLVRGWGLFYLFCWFNYGANPTLGYFFGLFALGALVVTRRFIDSLANPTVAAMVLLAGLVSAGLDSTVALCMVILTLWFLLIHSWLAAYRDEDPPWRRRLALVGHWFLALVVQLVLLLMLVPDDEGELIWGPLVLTALITGALQIAWANLDLLISRGQSLDRELLAAELAGRLEMGLSLAEALEDLRVTLEENALLARISNNLGLADIGQAVARGEHLSTALRRRVTFPSYWPRLLELTHSASLPAALRQLAHLESRKRPMLAVRHLALVVMAFLILAFNMTYTLAPLASMLHDQPGPSPLSVRASLWLQGLFENGFLMAMAAVLFLVLAFLPDVRGRLFTAISARLFPARLARLGQRAQLLGTLSGLLRLGIPTTAALEIASQALEERRLADQLRKAAHRGSGISQLLEEFAEFFPPRVHFLIRAGEASGQLPEALEAASRLQNEEYENAIIRLGEQVDTGLTVAAGVVVLAVCVLCIMPYQHVLTVGFGEFLLP